MKRLLIGDCRENLLTTLDTLLRHWGYRVLVSSRPAELTSFLQTSPPDLLILGTELLNSRDLALQQAVERYATVERRPLILLGTTAAPSVALPHELLQVPLDIFALFALLQKYLEKHPRQNLRLQIQIPAMLSRGESSQLSEALSLSARGAFLKTGLRLEKGDRLKVFIPLLGMKKELEIEGRVLYRIHPDPENQYLQGAGIEFTDLTEEDRTALEAFLESRFLRDVAANRRRLGDLSPDQLRSRVTLPSL